MEPKKIDARGLSCPQPVLLAMEAVKQNPGLIEITVDNPTARENVTRFLKKSGKAVSIREDGADIILTAE